MDYNIEETKQDIKQEIRQAKSATSMLHTKQRLKVDGAATISYMGENKENNHGFEYFRPKEIKNSGNKVLKPASLDNIKQPPNPSDIGDTAFPQVFFGRLNEKKTQIRHALECFANDNETVKLLRNGFRDATKQVPIPALQREEEREKSKGKETTREKDSPQLKYTRKSSSFEKVFIDNLTPNEAIGLTSNIKFITTEEREQRDKQVTEALNIISQSMEPPVHNVDRYKNWLLKEFHTNEQEAANQSEFYKFLSFLLGTPLTLLRAFWHYVILEIHLAYNLVLLYSTFFVTPPIIYFIIGLTLFWIKVLYELYRDILHRDDPLYSSNVAKEMSIAAAISASFGFILNIKAQQGEINEAWWLGENE